MGPLWREALNFAEECACVVFTIEAGAIILIASSSIICLKIQFSFFWLGTKILSSFRLSKFTCVVTAMRITSGGFMRYIMPVPNRFGLRSCQASQAPANSLRSLDVNLQD